MPLTKEQFRRAREAGKTVDEIIDFENQKKSLTSQSEVDPFLPGESRVQKLISEREDPLTTLEKESRVPFDFSTPKKAGKSLLKPFVTVGKLIDVPISRASAAVGGLGLGLQKEKGFGESFKMAREGLLGKKQFRAFDPVTSAGAPSIVASGLELAVEILIPLKILNKVNKIFRGPIQKLNDKKLLDAGNQLIKGADNAVDIVGKRLDKVYAPINKIAINPSRKIEIIEEISDLPIPIIQHLERKIGANFDEFFDKFTIEKARKLKGWIGELRPTAFGKAERGAVDLVTDKQINSVYGNIKRAMQSSLNEQRLGKEATKLLISDDIFSTTKNASRFLKRTVTDPTLREPTRIGRAASGLERKADLSFRQAVNTLKEASFSVNRNINKAVESLESFNRLEKIQKFGSRVGQSLVVGTVVGGVAGRILGEDR